MRRSLTLVSLILASLLAPAHGANVTVIAEGTFATYDDPMGLLPFAEPDPGTVFTIEFTYDDATPPSNADTSIVANYSDAISDLTLTIGSDSFGLLAENRIWVDNDFPHGDGTFADAWRALTASLISAGTEGAFLDHQIWMRLVNSPAPSPVPPLTSTELVEPEWPSQWSSGDITYSINLIDDQGGRRVAFATAYIDSITVVPIPTAALLFSSALALLGCMRRKSA